MSATDFLPRREADLRSFSVNFNSKINADPLAYGLTPGMAAEYNVLHNTFMAMYALATAPSTRTPSVVQAKKAAVRALRKKARQLARIIHSKRIATDTQKQDLGLTLRRPGGKSPRIPRPRTSPIIRLTPLEAGRVQIALGDLGQPTKKGRPTGVRSVLLFAWVGATPEPNVREWKLVRHTTRTKFIIDQPRNAQPGEKVWLTACWQNPRGERGPMCQPVYVYRQFSDTPQFKLKLAA